MDENCKMVTFTFLIVNIKPFTCFKSIFINFKFTFLIVNIKQLEIEEFESTLITFTFLIVNIKPQILKC